MCLVPNVLGRLFENTPLVVLLPTTIALSTLGVKWSDFLIHSRSLRLALGLLWHDFGQTHRIMCSHGQCFEGFQHVSDEPPSLLGPRIHSLHEPCRWVLWTHSRQPTLWPLKRIAYVLGRPLPTMSAQTICVAAVGGIAHFSA